MLRRHDDQYDNQSLANGPMRHTVDVGLGSNFQRGAPSRSSLQDLSTRVSVMISFSESKSRDTRIDVFFCFIIIYRIILSAIIGIGVQCRQVALEQIVIKAIQQ